MNGYKTLFECSRIRINPYVLGWIGVELELNFTQSTPTHVDWGEFDNIQTRPKTWSSTRVCLKNLLGGFSFRFSLAGSEVLVELHVELLLDDVSLTWLSWLQQLLWAHRVKLLWASLAKESLSLYHKRESLSACELWYLLGPPWSAEAMNWLENSLGNHSSAFESTSSSQMCNDTIKKSRYVLQFISYSWLLCWVNQAKRAHVWLKEDVLQWLPTIIYPAWQWFLQLREEKSQLSLGTVSQKTSNWWWTTQNFLRSIRQWVYTKVSIDYFLEKHTFMKPAESLICLCSKK